MLLFGSGIVQGQNFVHDIESAQQKAVEEDKKIMLVFSGSDWCKPCIKYRKTLLEDTAFVAFANEKLIMVEADFPYKKKNRLSETQTIHNEALAERYNPNGVFPLTVFLDSDQESLDVWEYDSDFSVSDYINYIQKTINNHAGNDDQ